MKSTCYLVLDRKGVDRMTKRPPDLYAGEVAVKVTVVADDRHFRQPYAEASLELSEKHLITPEVDVEVADPEPPVGEHSDAA